MKSKCSPALILSVVLALLAFPLLTARAAGARIEGKITDASGAAIEGAMISATNSANNLTSTATSDAQGNYKFGGLEPGTYTIVVFAQGFAQTQEVKVNEGATVFATLTLEVTAAELIKQYVLTPYVVDLFCGVTILVLMHIWLYRRKIKGGGIILLYLSLLSWFVGLSLELLHVEKVLRIPSEHVKYLLSMVSSVLFTLITFRLPRVREAFQHTKQYKLMSKGTVLLVFALSLIAWPLLLTRYASVGVAMDIVASCIAGITLAWGLGYSFHRYGNWLMAALTATTWALFVWKQFYFWDHERPLAGPLVPIFLGNVTFLIMIFIALCVAWAISDASRLNPIGESPSVQVISLVFDLRGSTRWANEVAKSDSNCVRDFIEELRKWSWSEVFALPEPPKSVKFLGDGFLFVWETPGKSIVKNYNAIVELACGLSTNYRPWVDQAEDGQRFLWGVPDGIGFGVDAGSAIRLTFENGSSDFLGTPLNYAAKMQDLARPNGGGVIQEIMWQRLKQNLKDKFPKEGVMKVGNEIVRIRMTEEVEFENN
ncbi:MAG TPA: carboxypeptidase regulatory-like domain-containing protein [Pyrinomonadaceae bacterium]|jgi:class 3 adenylate cyclase|nr:carboxypeptidase regulatory-like domain-containing protein [Pyrinomonadaceae bacterium]